MVGYWMFETTGVLRPAVERYLFDRKNLTAANIAALRAYFRQWMEGEFYGSDADQLRALLDDLDSAKKIERWIDLAIEAGIDPL